jgi:hypothetical protein
MVPEMTPAALMLRPVGSEEHAYEVRSQIAGAYDG